MDLKEFLKMVKEEWIVLIFEGEMIHQSREWIINLWRFENLKIKKVSIDIDPAGSDDYVLFLEVYR